MIFNEIKCHVNTSLGLVGDASPASPTVSAPVHSITFASRYKKHYDVTEAQVAYKFVFLDFYDAALCKLGFTICGSYIEQVQPPLPYCIPMFNTIFSFNAGIRH